MSEPLYKIAGDIIKAMDSATVLDGNGDEMIDPAAYNEIDGLYESFDTKIEACAAALRDIEARMQAASDECERLWERKTTLQRRKDWLKEYIRQNMEFVGRKKVEGSLFTVRVQATAGKVVIDEGAVLPERFMATKTTTVPDKLKIGEALEAGEEVPGATLVPGSTVVIR